MSDDKVTISERIRRKGEGASLAIVLGAFLLVGAVFFFGGVGSSPARLVSGTADADSPAAAASQPAAP